jgi:hypothetical protein
MRARRLLGRALSCTRFVHHGAHGNVIAAHSMDWKSDILSNLCILPRGLQRVRRGWPELDQVEAPVRRRDRQRLRRVTTDGVNEKGLEANLLWLGESEYPKFDGKGKPGLTIAAWAQYMLDDFETVTEAVAALNAYWKRIDGTVMLPGTASVQRERRISMIRRPARVTDAFACAAIDTLPADIETRLRADPLLDLVGGHVDYLRKFARDPVSVQGFWQKWASSVTETQRLAHRSASVEASRGHEKARRSNREAGPFCRSGKNYHSNGSSPSSLVRCIMRPQVGSYHSARCIVPVLSQITRSPTSHSWL